MKLKYYLRGLGIGIIVTALLMGYSNKNQAASNNVDEKMIEIAKVSAQSSNDEIYNTEETTLESETKTIENAIYGDIDQTTYSIEETISSDREKTDEDNSLIAENETINSTEKTVQDADSNNDEQGATLPKEVQELLDQNDTFVFEIVRGDDSGTVARKLYNAGLVDNASQFDAFLMQHGYDKRITIGRKEIPKGSTWMEIAEKISK